MYSVPHSRRDLVQYFKENLAPNTRRNSISNPRRDSDMNTRCELNRRINSQEDLRSKSLDEFYSEFLEKFYFDSERIPFSVSGDILFIINSMKDCVLDIKRKISYWGFRFDSEDWWRSESLDIWFYFDFQEEFRSGSQDRFRLELEEEFCYAFHAWYSSEFREGLRSESLDKFHCKGKILLIPEKNFFLNSAISSNQDIKSDFVPNTRRKSSGQTYPWYVKIYGPNR